MRSISVPFFPSAPLLAPQAPVSLAARIVHPPPMPLQPPIGPPDLYRECIPACRPSCQAACVDTCTNCVGVNGGTSNCPAFCMQSSGQVYPQPVFSQPQFQCADPCMPSCESSCVRAYMVNPAQPCYKQQTSPCVGKNFGGW